MNDELIYRKTQVKPDDTADQPHTTLLIEVCLPSKVAADFSREFRFFASRYEVAKSPEIIVTHEDAAG